MKIYLVIAEDDLSYDVSITRIVMAFKHKRKALRFRKMCEIAIQGRRKISPYDKGYKRKNGAITYYDVTQSILDA